MDNLKATIFINSDPLGGFKHLKRIQGYRLRVTLVVIDRLLTRTLVVFNDVNDLLDIINVIGKAGKYLVIDIDQILIHLQIAGRIGIVSKFDKRDLAKPVW